MFWLLYLVACVGGINREYNVLPLYAPGVSTGITRIAEIRTMFKKYGWKPYCITRFGTSFTVPH